MTEEVFTPEVRAKILTILKTGDCVELKKVNNQLVVVRIKRRVEIKTSANG